MKLLLLKHKTIKPYFNELNDELVLFGNWLTKLGVPYDFTFKDFDEDLEYQPYNGNAFYALSTSFMKRMAGKYETAGEFHSIFFLHAPTHEKSAGIFTTTATMNLMARQWLIFLLVKRMLKGLTIICGGI